MFVSKRKLHHKKHKTLKRVLLFFGLIFVVLAVFSYFFVYRPVKQIQVRAQNVISEGKKVKDSFSKNDIDLMEKQIAEFKKTYLLLEEDTKKIYWIGSVPVFGAYVKDAKHGIEAGEDLIVASELAVKAIAPHADLIGFKKGESSFVEKPAEERIATAVKTLDTIVKEVDDISARVDMARQKIDQIDPQRYPKNMGGRNVQEMLTSYKSQFESVASLFVDAKPLIKKLPEIMGANEKEKVYLVLFQNDAELRPTGGFWTAYAIFRVNNGKFRVEKSEDIYHLDDSISSHPTAPREIRTYHKGVSRFNIRDSNLSPDLPESLKLFNSLYKKSSSRVDFDGVFTMDTKVLVDILDVLGPTEASGIVFKTDIDERCDCPQVIYQLLDQIDRPVGYIKENRKGLLGDLLYVIMQKALGFSPSQYWGKLFNVFITNLQQKHILINLNDKSSQKAIEAINFGGRIREFDGDYLHINDTNFAGAKSNLFVSQEVDSETKIADDGTVERTVTINYKNPYPHSNCNLEKGGLCINATLRNWLRVYVPEGSKLVEFRGSSMKVQTYEDLGKTVFEGFMTVQPEGKATVIVRYTLPFKINNKDDYRLLVQKQPGTKGNLYNVSIDGQSKSQVELTTDTQFPVQQAAEE